MTPDRSSATRTLRRGAALAAAVAGLAAPGTAAAGWAEPEGGVAPVNASAAGTATRPSLAMVAGVPHVAWAEASPATGGVSRVRVSRLNAGGTDWQEIVPGASPVNIAAGLNAVQPHLADVGGRPWVAWSEADSGGIQQARVARLNVSGTAWEQPVSGASPVNFSAAQNASTPRIADAAGRPYVAWSETTAGGRSQVRVARLNASGTAWDDVGAELNVGGATSVATEPSLMVLAGVPWVAWRESPDGLAATQVRVARLNAGGTAWQEPVPGPSPVNASAAREASKPSLAAVGGVAHVAWIEDDGVNTEVRVARLNAAGNDWQEIVPGASPVNAMAAAAADSPSLADVGGVPHVAWTETDGTASQLRVARPAASGTAWQEVVAGRAPVNRSATGSAATPSLASVDGVPWVAFTETSSGGVAARVVRLEPTFGSGTAVPGSAGATLSSPVDTHGHPFRMGYSVLGGPGAAESGVVTLSGVPALLNLAVSGLTPSTGYTFRPFAEVGAGLRVLGPVTPFTTAAAAAPQPPAATPPPALIAQLVDRQVKGRAGRTASVRFAVTRAARVTVELRRGGRVVLKVERAASAGLGRVSFRLPRATVKYTLRLAARTADGKQAVASGTLVATR